MIDRIDQWLIDRVYQRVVDFTQRHPHWLGGQSMLLCALLSLIWVGLKYQDLDPVMLVLNGIGIFAMTLLGLLSRFPATMTKDGLNQYFRKAALIVWLVGLMASILSTKFSMLVRLIDMSMLSYFYFAACRPPAPPKPRTRLASAGGAA